MLRVRRGALRVEEATPQREQRDDRAPTALLCPGLTSSSDSVYIRRVAVALHAAGFVGVRFNASKNWAVVVEWEQHELQFAGDEKQGTMFTTVGLQYRF